MSRKSNKTKSKLPEIKWSFKEPKRVYSAKWYLLMIGFFAALILIAIFVIKSWLTVALFVIVLTAVLISTKRPREKVKFLINHDGIFVNESLYKFERYKFFGIRELNGYFSIVLFPVKKLETELVINFKEELGEQIVDFLAEYLPLQQLEESLVDRIIQKIGL